MVDYPTTKLEGPISGELVIGSKTATTGIVILSGSSGRIDVGRARLFAEMGATALALQWFGGKGQPSGICEIPLETFFQATDYLTTLGCQRIIFVGTSKGAEAALLVAAHDLRVSAVVAMSPSSVVWGNIGPGKDGIALPERSSWSLNGRPLDFVPADPGWEREYRDGLVSYRGLFERCLRHFDNAVGPAQIPVERASGEVVLVAGGDDALWPSDQFAEHLFERRKANGKSVSLVYEAEAGHRILLPGEKTSRSTLHAHGGEDEADARLGKKAWQKILALL
jgi:pimeloyl-ACP methyl ester carboxylesterase